MSDCYKCGAHLTGDEVGLYRKTVNRQATEFLCLDCLAEHLNTERSSLQTMIERLRATGCAFFAPKDKDAD